MASEDQKRGVRKVRDGTVISDAMDKTRVVMVRRRVRHPLYGKEMVVSNKMFAHDEENASSKGDTVRIVETRPISKQKRWRIVDVVKQ